VDEDKSKSTETCVILSWAAALPNLSTHHKSLDVLQLVMQLCMCSSSCTGCQCTELLSRGVCFHRTHPLEHVQPGPFQPVDSKTARQQDGHHKVTQMHPPHWAVDSAPRWKQVGWDACDATHSPIACIERLDNQSGDSSVRSNLDWTSSFLAWGLLWASGNWKKW